MNYSMETFHCQIEEEKAQVLKARDYKDPQVTIGGDEMSEETVVRRLSEKECERLQGFPDNWTLIGEPEEVEVKDYKTSYDINEDHEVEETKTLIGTHKEIQYFYTDSTGKRKKVTSSARYKALGNSIALPFWRVLARRIMAHYECENVTMGSLFDGIGGFPLVFSQCGCKPVWASEIEEFPMAVTRERFPEEEQ